MRKPNKRQRKKNAAKAEALARFHEWTIAMVAAGKAFGVAMMKTSAAMSRLRGSIMTLPTPAPTEGDDG